MKQIKTLTNSFVLLETDGNGNVLFELGYPKGGLTYLIKNGSIKFYLKEDYFYKNVVWSANIPLVVDGVAYGASTLPDALKKIFETKGSSGETITVDTELDENSLNPIANAPVATNIRELGESVLDRYTKSEVDSLLESFYTKIEANAIVAEYAAIDGETLSLNNANIGI